MVGKYSGGKTEDREVVSLRRLYRLEQSVPERRVPVASDRPVGRCNCRPPSNELPGCLPGLSSNTTGLKRSGENSVHDTRRKLPLYGDVFQFKECRIYLPKDDDQNVRTTTRQIEVYIDDMVVKSKVVSEHVGDLEVIFGILREHKLRLNASKCSFGVGFGKFLGYMVTHRGIEVSPNQIKVIHNL